MPFRLGSVSMRFYWAILEGFWGKDIGMRRDERFYLVGWIWRDGRLLDLNIK